MTPLTMTPVGAIGESDPALAPLPIMIAIRNAGMPTWPATAIPMGAMSAVDEMLPGPIDARTNESRKNIIGITPTLPRQRRTARWAIRSRVPFACACEKRSVTPARVRNSRVGKPAITSLALMPARKTPTTHASAMARKPTCRRMVQLTMMATASAPSERVATSMGREYMGKGAR